MGVVSESCRASVEKELAEAQDVVEKLTRKIEALNRQNQHLISRVESYERQGANADANKVHKDLQGQIVKLREEHGANLEAHKKQHNKDLTELYKAIEERDKARNERDRLEHAVEDWKLLVKKSEEDVDRVVKEHKELEEEAAKLRAQASAWKTATDAWIEERRRAEHYESVLMTLEQQELQKVRHWFDGRRYRPEHE